LSLQLCIDVFDKLTCIYSHISPYLKSLKSVSKVLSYDFSNEWDRNFLAGTLPFVNIALISNSVNTIEENKELIHFASSFGPDVVLVTSGQQGALLYLGNQFYYQAILPVENLVDTLGAGDAFAARFMTDYLDGLSVPIAMKNAAKSSAETCTYNGAFGHGAPLYIIKQDSKTGKKE